MVLTLIVIFVCVQALLGLILIHLNPTVARTAETAINQNKIHGMSLGCLWAIMGVISGSLWTWYAVQEQDWRFAAVAWVPLILGRLGGWARKIQQKAEATT